MVICEHDAIKKKNLTVVKKLKQTWLKGQIKLWKNRSPNFDRI